MKRDCSSLQLLTQFEYDASEYLPELVRICVERREGNRARFLEAKGRVGTSERVWRWRPGM